MRPYQRVTGQLLNQARQDGEVYERTLYEDTRFWSNEFIACSWLLLDGILPGLQIHRND